MYIKEVTLDNFRIYKGHQNIIFDSSDEKNIFVICGNNGFGKTTFLISLVWCLYGKTMKDVDGIYQRQILDSGGYQKFLSACLNRLARSEGQQGFEVSIKFGEINIPTVPCNEVIVTRSYNDELGKEKLTILIDGQENELTNEVGPEVFIQDFILPKEIAKFFFFDAEKIVSLAELKSIEEKRRLSQAYAEVLGIKKYEDLKTNLLNLRVRFRKEVAGEAEREKLDQLEKEIELLESKIELNSQRIDDLIEEKALKKKRSDDLQEKLIREGNSITLAELKMLKREKERVENEIENLKKRFQSLIDLAPFAIAGKTFKAIEEQVKREALQAQKGLSKAEVEDKTQSLIKELAESPFGNGSNEVYQQHLAHLETLLQKHFTQEARVKKEKVLHDFSDEERYAFLAIMHNLRTSYKDTLKEVAKSLKNNRLRQRELYREIADAEAKEGDPVIQEYRERKQALDFEVLAMEEEIINLSQQIGMDQTQLNSKLKVRNEFSRKVKLAEAQIEKDALAKRLIGELNDFIKKLKNEKKASLELRIKQSLNALMHKTDFVDRVEVVVSDELIDIHLYNRRKEEISKDTLSKGEQQLYATAIMKGLVEESNIQFPVFIDSPLQKFDGMHARNVITEFYPNISKQVVIFPLVNKEMSESEYDLLLNRINGAYLIDHKKEDISEFKRVQPSKLFQVYQEKYKHV